MEIKGTLKKLHPEVLRNEFKSRKIWLTTTDNPEYPQTIEIEVNQAKVDMFNGISIGAPVICHVNLRGREWTGTDGVTKVFNTIVCWKVEANGAALPTQAAPAISTSVELPDTGDLPF